MANSTTVPLTTQYLEEADALADRGTAGDVVRKIPTDSTAHGLRRAGNR